MVEVTAIGILVLALVKAVARAWSDIQDAKSRKVLADRADPMNPNLHLIAGKGR